MYLDQFLNYLKNERNFSKKTIRSYVTDLNQFFLFFNEDVSLVNTVHLREWVISLKKSGL